MPATTLQALDHAIAGPPTFVGIIKANTGQYVLWDATRIWFMDDASTAATLEATVATGTLGAGAACRQYSDDVDVIAILWDDAGVYKTVEVRGSPLVADIAGVTIDAGTVAPAGIAAAGARMAVCLEDGTLWFSDVDSDDPLDWASWSNVGTIQVHIPGPPMAHCNPWCFRTGRERHIATSLGILLDDGSGNLQQVSDDTLPDIDGERPAVSFAHVHDNKFIVGGYKSGGTPEFVVKADVSFSAAISITAGEVPMAVGYDPVNTKYLVAVKDNSNNLKIYHAASGGAWAAATMGTYTADGTPGRFASNSTTAFYINRIANGADYRLVKSTNATTWNTSVRTGTDKVMGVYTDQGTGAGQLIELNRADGKITVSTDSGTSFGSASAAARIPVADCPFIYWIEEINGGVIAWGDGGQKIFTQVEADIHTVDWIDADVDTTLYGSMRGLSVNDAGDLFLVVVDPLSTTGYPWQLQHQSWDNLYTTWAENTSDYRYLSSWYKAVSFAMSFPTTALVALKFGPNGEAAGAETAGYMLASYDGADSDTYHVVGIEPTKVCGRSGGRPGFFLTGRTYGLEYKAAYSMQAQQHEQAAGFWTVSGDVFFEQTTAAVPAALAENNGVMAVINTDGGVHVSKDGEQWYTVVPGTYNATPAMQAELGTADGGFTGANGANTSVN